MKLTRIVLLNKLVQTTLKPNNIKISKNFLSSSSVTQSKVQEMDYLKSNPYFDKYKDKLKTVYENDRQTFESAIKNLDGFQKVVQKSEGVKKAPNYSYTKDRKLDSVMKVELLENLNETDIRDIWITYHKEKSRLCDTLLPSDYDKIEKRSREIPTFIFPLPRKGQGYEFILAQWLNNECHLTPLINYQAHGANAPSIMTFIFFKDLATNKNIILEMAEVDLKNSNLEDAAFLQNQLKMYYLKSNENDEKWKIMDRFIKSPDAFKHMDLIEQLKIDKLVESEN